MKRWHINVVRVPMNEDCWLGINGVKARYSGRNYRQAIAAFVSRLHAAVPVLGERDREQLVHELAAAGVDVYPIDPEEDLAACLARSPSSVG